MFKKILFSLLFVAITVQGVLIYRNHRMHEKYKETSLGGLAVNVPNC